jgi:hypothetical protein
LNRNDNVKVSEVTAGVRAGCKTMAAWRFIWNHGIVTIAGCDGSTARKAAAHFVSLWREGLGYRKSLDVMTEELKSANSKIDVSVEWEPSVFSHALLKEQGLI